MLRAAAVRVRQAGWTIVNVDCIVFAQRPKVLPHRDAIRRRMAEILGIDAGQIGLKAKTGEQRRRHRPRGGDRRPVRGIDRTGGRLARPLVAGWRLQNNAGRKRPG